VAQTDELLELGFPVDRFDLVERTDDELVIVSGAGESVKEQTEELARRLSVLSV
jgi:hypothetical protein